MISRLLLSNAQFYIESKVLPWYDISKKELYNHIQNICNHIISTECHKVNKLLS